MQETQVRFLGQEDPLEKEMTTHFSILAWRIPWTEETDGYECEILQITLSSPEYSYYEKKIVIYLLGEKTSL